MWPFRSSNSIPIGIGIDSIHLTALTLVFLVLWASVICSKYDNLSLIIYTSSESSGLICLFVFLFDYSQYSQTSSPTPKLKRVTMLCILLVESLIFASVVCHRGNSYLLNMLNYCHCHLVIFNTAIMLIMTMYFDFFSLCYESGHHLVRRFIYF